MVASVSTNAAVAQSNEDNGAENAIVVAEPSNDEISTEQTKPDRSPDPALDEVVVTAQKRPEDVQDVAMSITAIGGESLKRQNLGDLGQMSQLVPNLEITASPAFNSISMRGIGSGRNRGFEQSVAIIIDDVFYGRPAYLGTGLLDLAAVEVLRGPQGTLYGKNSAAGALHLKTASPEPEWSFDADALYGSINQRRVRGAFGGPLVGEKLSFRLAAAWDKNDGDVFNTTNGKMVNDKNNMNARLKLKYDPDGPTDFLLSSNYLTIKQAGNGLSFIHLQPRHIAAMQVFDPQTTDDAEDEKTHRNFQDRVDRAAWDITLTANWDINDSMSLVSVSNYAQMYDKISHDGDISPVPLLGINTDEEYSQISQEVRLTGEYGPISYVGGAFFFRNNMYAEANAILFLEAHEAALVVGSTEILFQKRFCNALAASPPGQVLLQDFDCVQSDFSLNNAEAGRAGAQLAQARIAIEGTPPKEESYFEIDQQTTTYALFGQATWEITEKFKFTVGGRYSYEKKEIDTFHELYNLRPGGGTGRVTPDNPNGALAFTVTSDLNIPYAERRDRLEQDFSPKLAAQYYLDDDVMVYASVSSGFKSGGFSDTANNVIYLEFEEERSLTYETGIRSEFWDRRLRVNLTGFYTDYEDLQITTATGRDIFVTNAPKTIIKGIEFDYAFALAPFLILTGNGAFTDATYEDFKTAPCTATFEGEGPCDLTGREVNNAPSTKLSQSILSFFPIGNFALLQTGVTAAYKGAMYTSIDLDPFTYVPGFWSFRAQLSLRDFDERWVASLFADNISDKFILGGTGDGPGWVGSYVGGSAPRRAISAEVRVRF